jgi:Right handed beta helix region
MFATTTAVGPAMPQTLSATKRSCNRWASPTGNDSAPGTKKQPLRTVQKLVDGLAPGESGCLLAGTYTEDVSIRRGGSNGKPVTLRGASGVTATIRGRFWIADSANWVVVTHLHLNGMNAGHLPSPTVNGDHATFTDNDVTNDHMGGLGDGDGTCFLLGDPYGTWGHAWYATITRNSIHDCGTSNNLNHGVYVGSSYYAQIAGNWIYNNADRGIQLSPNAQHTLIRNNVIAGNGEGIIFSGNSTYASSDNLVTHNIIVYSRIRWDVEYYWGSGSVGTNNVVTENCLYGGYRGDLLEPQIGYTATANLVVQPVFASNSWPSALKGPRVCKSYAPKARL